MTVNWADMPETKRLKEYLEKSIRHTLDTKPVMAYLLKDDEADTETKIAKKFIAEMKRLEKEGKK